MLIKDKYYLGLHVVTAILLLLCPTIYYIKLNQYPVSQLEILWLLMIIVGLGSVSGVLSYFLNWALRTIFITFLVMFSLSFFPEFHSQWPMTIGFLVVLTLVILLGRFIMGLLFLVASVFLGAVLIFPVGNIQTEPTLKEFPTFPIEKTGTKNLRPVLHILLDEHIGIDGIPLEMAGATKLKQSLQDFYVKNNFHLYTKAYSHYSRSYNAVPNILNFFPRSLDNIYFQGEHLHNVLSENAYFHYLSDLGYNLRVYQSSYIDFCHLPDIHLQSCYTYPAASIQYIATLPIPVMQKLSYLSRGFLLTSYLYEILLRGYEDQLRDLADRFHYELKHWPWYHAHTSTLASMSVFSELAADLQKDIGGTFFFAHIILPHSPYVFDEHCHVNPNVNEWDLHTYLGDELNTIESRQKRYTHYLPQVACVQKNMAILFQQMKKLGIYDDTTIVIHSDHGSRIMLNGPFEVNQDKLTLQDFNDGFSALFAIKSPNYKPGVSQKQLAVDYLLARFVERLTGNALPLKERESYIFLSPQEAKSQGLMLEMPLNKFLS